MTLQTAASRPRSSAARARLARRRAGWRTRRAAPPARVPPPALLAAYREAIVETDCTYGRPIGSLALEIHEPDPPVRERLAANFTAWIDAVERCLIEAGDRIPRDADRRPLAGFVLTTMEGGVMMFDGCNRAGGS